MMNVCVGANTWLISMTSENITVRISFNCTLNPIKAKGVGGGGLIVPPTNHKSVRNS